MSMVYPNVSRLQPAARRSIKEFLHARRPWWWRGISETPPTLSAKEAEQATYETGPAVPTSDAWLQWFHAILA